MTKRLVTRLAMASLMAGLLVAMLPGAASACSCVQTTTGQVIDNADIVFVGREVSRTEPVNEPADAFLASVAVTFDVIEAYKGDVAQQMTLYTGRGDADCGVGPLNGHVGIVASTDSADGRATFHICGSVQDPAAIASLLDPIDLVDAPAPIDNDAGSGVGRLIWAAALGLVVVAGGVAVVRRRRDVWQDGWNSGA